jgi:hypothetical protein
LRGAKFICFIFIVDCKVSSIGDSVPEKCQFWFDLLDQRKLSCLVKECAKECQDKGGDEIFTYIEKVPGFFNDYIKYACCQSKTSEQKQNAAKMERSCKIGCDLVNQILN